MSDAAPADRLENIDRRLARVEQILPTLATKDDLLRFATKDDLLRFATKDDLLRFATKDDLLRFATKDDLKRFATKDDLLRFATKEDLKDLRVEIRQDVRVLLEEERERWKALTDAVIAATENLRRIESESKARDHALDRPVLPRDA